MIETDEQLRLLLVDDETDILNLLGSYFERKNISYRTARDGIEALERMEEAPVTVVITDLHMPRMDGMQLIRKIKERWPDTDIITITGYKNNFSYTDVINAGASDFISKPFNFDELEAKLNRIIRERNLRAQLQSLSTRDPITELYNRRYFDGKIEEECERAARQGYPLYLMIIDLDNFKQVNDEYGHQTGDYLLKALADVLRNSTRNHVDIICRYGGDEFAVIIPHATEEQVNAIAERMRNNYLRIDNKGTTLSIGVSCLAEKCRATRKDINALIKRADDAMYAAKRAGGNKVVIFRAGNEQQERRTEA